MSSIPCKKCRQGALNAEELVCESCSLVTEQIQFGSAFSTSSPSNFNKNHLSSSKPTTGPDGMSYGIKTVKNLKKSYNLSSDVEAEILLLFHKIYKVKKFHTREDFVVLAGCCLYYIQRKNNKFISLCDICSKLKCTKRRFYQFSKFVNFYSKSKISDLFVKAKEKPEHTFDGELSAIITGLVPRILGNVQEDSKKQLFQKVVKLLKLADSYLLITGRPPQACIIAASFLCWKSMDHRRRDIVFSKFCSDFSIPPSGAKGRIFELQTMLVKLAKRIPYYSKIYIHPKNLILHLDYILENSKMVRNILKGDCMEGDTELDLFSNVRVCRNTPREVVDTQSSKYGSDMCTTDVEISDTETSSYIRSDAELEFIKNLHLI